jgi:O-antigen biosynthesis protein
LAASRDTGTNDDTMAIATKVSSARVSEWTWRDDFAAARNESLRYATGDWILVVDADETLPAASADQLRTVCAHWRKVVAYTLRIVSPAEQDSGLVPMSRPVRLFRNIPGGAVHCVARA